jgi:hypothetical protein
MQNIDFESGFWAVVHSGSRKYIGSLRNHPDLGHAKGHFQGGQDLIMGPVFELYTGMHLINTPNGPGMSHIVQVMPLDGARCDSVLRVKPTAIHFFADMKEEDQERHKELVKRFLEQADTVRRMSDAGIVPAKQVPGGGFRGST